MSVLCFLGDHVTAAVKFELEMVPFGFALPLIGFVQACPRSDSPALFFTYLKQA